jgi:hypothetical protein
MDKKLGAIVERDLPMESHPLHLGCIYMKDNLGAILEHDLRA